MSLNHLRRFSLHWWLPRWLEAMLVLRLQKKCVAGNKRRANNVPRRLFVDVSVIARKDAGTGIQRVVRSVGSELFQAPPTDWDVIPVIEDRRSGYLCSQWPLAAVPNNAGVYMCARPGDVFLGLDFSLDGVCFHRKQLMQFKSAGGEAWFFMYDLLPIQRPDWFTPKLTHRYRRWLRNIAALANGFYCISPTVQADLAGILDSQFGVVTGYESHVIPLSGRLEQSLPTEGLPHDVIELEHYIRSTPTALVVGTLEPRKGHADVLDAFEYLWKQGHKVNLMLVGRPGWKTDVLQDRIRRHPEYGRRLRWRDDLSDEALSRIYSLCHGVVVPSLAEGFGLPVVEALAHGKPVMARDIPVFRAHAAHGVSFFKAESSPSLIAEALVTWFQSPSPTSSLTDRGWAETKNAIMRALT